MRDEVGAVNLLDGAFYAGDPYPAFAWMRRNQPVYRDEESGVWGVTRYEDVKAAATAPETFSSAGGIRPDYPAMPYMIDMDDPEHRRRRKQVSSGFMPKSVNAMRESVGAICDELIDQVCEVGTCDFVADIAAPLPLYVIGDMLGVAPADRPDLLRWSDDMLSALGAPDETAMNAASTAFAEYSTYIADRIARRRRDGDDSDLIGRLSHAEVDGERLDDESLTMETLLILIGGDETTRHVISGGTEALLAHPAQHERLRDDPQLLPGAIDEMLRWVSPIKNMARTATRDTTLGNADISAGDTVLLLYPSANRDEEVFTEPERFDIDRSPNDHVAFGFGPHFCLGSRLARLELDEMMQRVLARLPDLRVARGAPDPLPRRAANFVSGIETMPVEFTPTPRVGAATG
ncbi:cytochrome P450, family 142, subfamily A, polypeptide 1 [Haloechinothrix alba]|uniref:Cytochrome P450, family 142, subfamily A, polypeptide 1 n=1 Tax=Haloechinothrix alba TaxID=664784 RepID=A0A239A2S5_9PSEU|nr:cytochrome P450 [Haloechinothrix alba]SNR89611.1 cytochrome P450, family 142, subfamily A, polypeptide 1 [Haloechinothrix alba]